MTKKHLLTIFIIVWLIVIFLFSSASSTSSNDLSYTVSNYIITITNKLGLTDLDGYERYYIVYKINKPIRKIAHMTEYFILACLVFHVIKLYRPKSNGYLLTFIFCFLYAITDEFHQLSVTGRNGQFIDCIIDSIGCLTYLTLKCLKDKFFTKNLGK